jgi:nitroreductase
LDTYDLLMKRRSVRNFRDRAVPEPVVEQLLNAASNAPSGGNIQPLSIVVVDNPGDRRELAAMVGGQPWVKNAPLSMIFCLDFHRVKRWAEMFDVEFLGERCLGSFLIAYADVMCAAQTVVVLAESLGLGSVYIGTIQSSIGRAREYFHMPEGVLPLMVLTLGYPKSVPRSIRKLPTDLIAHHGRYRTMDDTRIRNAFESKYGSVDDHIDSYLERAYIEVLEADKQHDERWSDRAKERMKALGIKSNAEFLFKLRYPQRVMVGMNEDLAAALREAGFDFPGMMSEPGGHRERRGSST